MYGKLPSELIALPLEEFNLVSLIAGIGQAQDNKDAERAHKK